MLSGQGGEWEERWTGGLHLENEWQSFRTKKDRLLETDPCLSRMRSRSAQAGGQGGGHLRQRHDDHRRSERGREEIMVKEFGKIEKERNFSVMSKEIVRK